MSKSKKNAQSAKKSGASTAGNFGGIIAGVVVALVLFRYSGGGKATFSWSSALLIIAVIIAVHSLSGLFRKLAVSASKNYAPKNRKE